MPRPSKPYYRSVQKRWVCTIEGNRVTLGKTKKQADAEFARLMQSRETVTEQLLTVYQLSQVYLDWCQQHRKKSTYENHLRYLKKFLGHIGKSMKIGALKKHHVLKWAEKQGESPTTQNDVISIVQRMFNWAVEQEYLTSSPIPLIKKPRRQRREVVYTASQWKLIKAEATGPLVPLLDFMWATGCRPKEARTLEARHIHDDLVIFPPDESKGESDSRVIFLTDEAKEIVDKLLAKNLKGPLFRNSQGNPWTTNALRCRMRNISKRVGFRVIAYGARHSYATNALIRSVDTVSLSHLMGHKSTRMIQNYAHLAQNVEFLRQQAKNAVQTQEDS